jgi:hypothetical protein
MSSLPLGIRVYPPEQLIIIVHPGEFQKQAHKWSCYIATRINGEKAAWRF